MKKIVTTGISAIIGLSVLGASFSTPAYAGKKQRKIFAGLAIGAVTGAIIAGELSRRADKKRARKKHRKAYRKNQRQVRHEPRLQPRNQRRWQRDRYDDNYDRIERDFDVYSDGYRPEPRRQASNNNRGHIQRCINAYRSYDPQSDTYIGNDGRERVCRK